MDPGTVLAVVSLSFQIFGGCVKGFTMLSGAHNLGKDASLLQTMLSLEEYRFIQWAREVGLIDDEVDGGPADTSSSSNTVSTTTGGKAKDGGTRVQVISRPHLDEPKSKSKIKIGGGGGSSSSSNNNQSLNPRLNYALASELMAQLENLLTADQLRKRYHMKLVPAGSSTPTDEPDESANDDNPKALTFREDTFTSTVSTSTPAAISSSSSSSTVSPVPVLQKLVSDRLRRRILARAKLIQDETHLPKRLWWAAVDRKSFQDMVRDVRTLVDGLWALLDPIQREDSSWLLNEVLAKVVQLSKDVGELRALQTSHDVSGEVSVAVDLKVARIEINDPDPSDPDEGMSGRPRRLPPPPPSSSHYSHPYPHPQPNYSSFHPQPPPHYAPSSLDYLNLPSDSANLSPTAATTFLSASNWQDPNPNVNVNVNVNLPPINRSLLTGVVASSSNPNAASGLYNNEPVWLEYKRVPRRMKGKLLSRVKGLAFLLSKAKHSSFRTLRCIGFLEEEESFVFVYNYPSFQQHHSRHSPSQSGEGARGQQDTHPNWQQPKSLNELIRENKTLKSPSVTTRLALALQLCQTVLTLHTAGWLHKDLRSENVMFFPAHRHRQMEAEEQAPQQEQPEPYITGFSFSRFDSPAEISEQPSSDPLADIYRHPHAQGDPSASFQKHMDLYSLGVILVELAEWRALKHLVKDCVDVRKVGNSSSGSSNIGANGSSVTVVSVSSNDMARLPAHLINTELETGQIRYRMGDTYAAIVRVCLNLGLTPEDAAPDTLPVLLDMVRKLEKCQI